MPPFGLERGGAEHAAVALVVLGIVIAAARRPVVSRRSASSSPRTASTLAGLSVPGGMPAVIELGLLFDLVVAVGVAAAFGARIHGEFGTADTSVLRSLRD